MAGHSRTRMSACTFTDGSSVVVHTIATPAMIDDTGRRPILQSVRHHNYSSFKIKDGLICKSARNCQLKGEKKKGWSAPDVWYMLSVSVSV